MASIEDGSCWYPSAGACDCAGNTLDAVGECGGTCALDEDGDGVCDEIYGCTIVTACNYNPEATNYDASCDFFSCLVLGCTRETACNFDVQANSDNGSCDYQSCVGCLLADACNYNANATQSAPCEWPEAGYNCEGGCVLDLNENGICDPEEIHGCMYPNASNFVLEASFDDGSCLFEGCTDENADSYSPVANASDPEACMSMPILADFNLDGFVQLLDFTDFLVSMGQSYPGWTLVWLEEMCQYGDAVQPSMEDGCTYETAWNFDALATVDLNSCQFLGCTDKMALNYDALANEDNGSCYFTPCPDINRDQTIDIQDLLDFFQLWGMSY
jgi:hypothetical protein